MSSEGSRVREIITEYIQPNGTLSTMSRIHNEFTGEVEEFGEWEAVEIEYISKDWDEERLREFALSAKEVIESGVDEIAESYLDILDEDIDADILETKFENNEITEDTGSGFRFERNSDGSFSGMYYYETLDIDVTSSGMINRLTNQKSIPFRVEPEENLIIVETTYSPYVQKIGGVFRNQLEIPVNVCGDITAIPSQATERVSGFINEFDRECARGDWE